MFCLFSFGEGVGIGRGGGDGKETRLNTYIVLILSFYFGRWAMEMEGEIPRAVCLGHSESGPDGAASLYHRVEGRTAQSKTRNGRTVVVGAE